MTKTLASAFVIVSAIGIQQSASTATAPISLSLYLLSHKIGEERSEITTSDDARVLRSHFVSADRGTPVALDSTLPCKPDFTPLSFESHGKSYRYFSVDASVPQASGAPASFTMEGVAPIAAQGLLVRYWLAHGKPASIRLEPSGDPLAIRQTTTVLTIRHIGMPPLQEYTIDGLAWGLQRVDRCAFEAAISSVGVLGFEAVDPLLDPGVNGETLARTAIRVRLKEAATESAAVPVLHRTTFALTKGRLIDATGAPPVERANVIVRNGRIEAAGPADATPVPRVVPIVDVAGQTILPGLWDMHAHVALAERGPAYLGSGVTTARDMGGELAVVTALRDGWRDGQAIGPRLLLAGLVDGPGPASFGHVTAANPDEGRAAVRKYKDAG